MIALLDTNAFLRWVEGDNKLSPKAKSCIANPDNEILVSVVVAWELAIKAGQGAIRLALPVGRYVASHIEANGFRLLGIELDDVAAIEALPLLYQPRRSSPQDAVDGRSALQNMGEVGFTHPSTARVKPTSPGTSEKTSNSITTGEMPVENLVRGLAEAWTRPD